MVGSLSMEAKSYINKKNSPKAEVTNVINGFAFPILSHESSVDDDNPLRHIVSTTGCDGVNGVDENSPVSQLQSLPDIRDFEQSTSTFSIDNEQCCSARESQDVVKDIPRVKFESQTFDDGHHVQFHEELGKIHTSLFNSPDIDDYNDNSEEEGSDSNTTSCSSSSEDGDSERYAEARAPDGGWGWVIVFVSFMINLIADGVTFSFGVIYLEFINYFGESKSKTAWIGSLFLAIPLLSGPIASYLTDRYGCRKVSIAGGILAALGFVISAFINSIELLFFTFGILSGFGLSLCYVAAIVIVAYYFEKKRSFATGLSVCGSGIGTFIFPPFIDFLITEYGWRGTTLILAGLFLNLCVCGALMRDLEFTKKKKTRRTKERKLSNGKHGRSRATNTASSMDSSSQYSQYHTPPLPGTEEVKRLLQVNSTLEDAAQECAEESYVEPVTKKNNRLFSSLVSLPTFVRNSEKVPLEVLEGLSTNRHLYAVLVHNYPNLLISSRSISDSGYINEQTRQRSAYNATVSPKYSAQFLHGSKPFPSSPKESKDELPNLNPVKEQEMLDEKSVIDDSTVDSTALKKPEKRRSILKKKSESMKRGLAAVSHTNSTWWNNKRYTTDYGNESPRLPTAYLRDLKVHRHSLTYRGAMLNIGRYRLRASSCPDIYRNSMTTIAEQKTEWYAGIVDLWYALTDMMDFSYFSNINFLLFAISNFLLYTWYDVPYVYLADYAVEKGFSKTDSIYIISIIGILNMLGEIGFGWAGDRSWFNSKIVYAVSVAICGLFVAVMPMLTVYSQICFVAGGFGLLIAVNYSLTSIILVESISLERFTNAYGLLLLVQGIANLVGPPLAGWIYEVTGNWNVPFYLAGFFITLSGCLLELTTFIEAFKNTYTSNTNNHDSNGMLSCINSNETIKSKTNSRNNHANYVC